MDSKDSQDPPDTKKQPLKENKDTTPNSSTPQDEGGGKDKHKEKIKSDPQSFKFSPQVSKMEYFDPTASSSNKINPFVKTRKMRSSQQLLNESHHELKKCEGFYMPKLNFDSDTSDDVPYTGHTAIVHSSESDENDETPIPCCKNLHKRYQSLYSCHVEEDENLQGSTTESKHCNSPTRDPHNPELNVTSSQPLLKREDSPEGSLDDMDVTGHHGEKDTKDLKAKKVLLNVYRDEPLAYNNLAALSRIEDIDDWNVAQGRWTNEVLVHSEPSLNLDIVSYNLEQRPPARRGDRPASKNTERPSTRRGERPSTRRGERPSTRIEQSHSNENQESNSCPNMIPVKLSLAIESLNDLKSPSVGASFSDDTLQYHWFCKMNDNPTCRPHEDESRPSNDNNTSNFNSSLEIVKTFFEMRLDATHDVNSKFCTRKPRTTSCTSYSLPLHYSAEEAEDLAQNESGTTDNNSYVSTSSSCTNVNEETSEKKRRNTLAKKKRRDEK